MKKTKRSFRWAFGYIFIRLIFFTWVVIAISWWYNISWTELWIMTLWISIAILALIIMVILHIIIFRMSDKAREKWLKILKRIWKIIWIILLVGIVLLITNIIYGKIQYSKIPEVDESMFYRTGHQTKLPDDEDALIQLEKLYPRDTYYTTTRAKTTLEKLESAYFLYNWNSRSHINNSYKDSEIWREWHQDECILVYSWEEASCGSWVWNKDTINRILNSITEDTIINWKKVSIRDFIEANEQEIKAELEELNHIVSMDYYLPNDQILTLLPTFQQGFARDSMVLLLYYTEKENWDMVEYIIKLNYKSVDIMNHLWGLVTILMSNVIQDTIDNTVNSIMKLFPEELRQELAEWYTEITPEKEELIHETAKWEYVLWNEQTKSFNWFNWLQKLLIKFPLYSKKDSKKIVLYWYSLIYNQNTKEFENLENNIVNKLKKSIYNRYWMVIYDALMPRVSWTIDTRIDRNLYHKKALINNLKSGEYDMWYNEKQRTDSPYLYEEYKLPTE